MHKIKKIFFIVLSNFIVLIILDLFVLKFIGFKTLAQLHNKNQQFITLREDSVYLLPFYKPDSLGLLKPCFSYGNSPVLYYSKLNSLEAYLKNTTYNEEGFRGNSIKYIPHNKKIVMFVGDSYVFGYDAKPLSNSFVDIIQRKDTNLYCLNFGIGGADLATYSLLAEKYVKIVKPDIMLCCLYVDNDFVWYDKKIRPFEYNDIYVTNCGTLNKANYSYSKDSVEVYPTYKDAYNNLLNINMFNAKYAKFPYHLFYNYSRIYSMFVSVFYKQKYKLNTVKYLKSDQSMVHINRIINTCVANNTKLIFTIIPKFGTPDFDANYKVWSKSIDTSVKVYYPKGINLSHYDYDLNSTSHFNNSGYTFYAEFLYSLIDSVINYKHTVND